MYVQYGCGLTAPESWVNFDASPVLRLQRLPALGPLLTRGRVRFPGNVRFGDVTKGLALPSGSCRGVYASHVLEHLAYEDARKAMAETLRLLAEGGRFRCVVPDLRSLAARYVEHATAGDPDASHAFMIESHLGQRNRSRGTVGVLEAIFGNSRHLWMWDASSLVAGLRDVGFSDARIAQYHDSEDKAFREVEEAGRFRDAIAVEATR